MRLVILAVAMSVFAADVLAEERTYTCHKLFASTNAVSVESVSVRVHAHDVLEAISLCEPEFQNYANPDGYGVPKSKTELRRYLKRVVYWPSYGHLLADAK